MIWPFNANAAVSITYDDGNDSNLTVAMPDLEDRGFRGTFFISPGLWAHRRPDDWRRACRRGHEIANHTWDHPCETLRQYTVDQFASKQTGRAEHWLNTYIGRNGVPGVPDEFRTFAYTCGIELLGAPQSDTEAHQNYRTLVETTFWAARSGGAGPATAPGVLASRFTIPAQALTYGYDNADTSIAYCEAAAAMGGWAVLIFHDVVKGAPRELVDTSRMVHAQILDYLFRNRARYWVAPFREVFRHIVATG